MSFVGSNAAVSLGDVVELLALFAELQAKQVPAVGTVDDKGNVHIPQSGPITHADIKEAVMVRRGLK